MANLSLIWQDELNFKSGPEGPAIQFGGDPAAPGPMQVVAYAVMGCMAMDVVHTLKKGRHDLRGLTVSFEGERAPEPPKRYTAIHLKFDVTGPVSEDAVTRAIQLSHEKYCSVANSLRTDITFTTSVTVQP